MTATRRVSHAGSASALQTRWPWILAGALTVAAFAAAMLATRDRLQLSPDSVAYLSLARRLSHGEGLTDFNGDPMTHWAPGFPVLLWMIQGLGLTAISAGRVINSVALAGTVLLGFVLLRRHVDSPGIAIGGLVVVFAGPTLLRNSAVMLSEPIFCVIVLAFLLVLEQLAWKSGDRRALLLATVALAWAAFLLRYPGIVLIPAGAITLLLARPKHWRENLRVAVAFAGLSSIAPIVWVARNALTDAPDLLGRRVPSGLSPFGLIRPTLEGMGSLFVDTSTSAKTATGLALVAVLAIAALAIVRRPDAAWSQGLVPLVVFCAAYVAFAMVSNWRTGSDLSPRVLAPVFVPLVTIACVLFEQLWNAAAAIRWVRAALGIGAALVLVVMVGRTVSIIDDPGTSGEAVAAQHAHVLRAAGKLDRDATLFSDAPWAVVLRTGRDTVKLAPREPYPGLNQRPVSVCEVVEAATVGDSYLVWLGRSGDPPPYLVGDRTAVDLEPASTHDDGAIYRIRPAADASRLCG